ncbi:MAG: Uma2 family endonuclease [Deltaproteobacteria bacterium]|nr:Uma2 family endonuclease [Deltaproteobacteria bacterium]
MSVPAAAVTERLRPITFGEWVDLPEDEGGEFVDGYLVEEEDVGALHDVVVAWVVALLSSWTASRGAVVGVSDTRFALSPRRGRKPDAWMYLAGHRPPAEGAVSVPPDLLVEVVSAKPRDQRRDRVEKLGEYAAFGVRWYWIVDPQLRSFEVFELGADGRYSHALGATAGRLEDVPGLADLIVDLDALWATADSLG